MKTLPWIAALLAVSHVAQAQTHDGTYELAGRQGSRNVDVELRLETAQGTTTVTRTRVLPTHLHVRSETWTGTARFTSATAFEVEFQTASTTGLSASVAAGSTPGKRYRAQYSITDTEVHAIEETTANLSRNDAWRWSRDNASGIRMKSPSSAGVAPAYVLRKAQSHRRQASLTVTRYRSQVLQEYNVVGDNYRGVMRFSAHVRAQRYFKGATWRAGPVPQGYTAYMAAYASGPDPQGVMQGRGDVALLFNARGELTRLVYTTETGDTADDRALMPGYLQR